MRKIRFVVATLLIVVWGASVASAQSQTVALTVPTVKAATGAELSVPISVTGGTDVGAVHLELTFDPAVLEPKAVTRGRAAPANTLVESKAASGRYVIGLVSSDKITADGVLVVATFKVIAKKGATSNLGLDKLQAWEGDVNRFEFKVVGTNGRLTVTGKGGFPWIYLLIAAGLAAGYAWYRRSRRPKPQAPSALSDDDSWFYVDHPEPLVASDRRQLGTLTPGKWYRSAAVDGEWIEVVDDSGQTGWVARAQARWPAARSSG